MPDQKEPIARVVARFTTTPEEFVEAIKALSGVLYGFGAVSLAQGIGQRVKLFVIIAILSFAILTFGNFIARQPGGFTAREFYIVLLVAVVTAFAVLVGLGQFQMRRMRKALSRQPAQADVEIVAEETGIWWNTAAEKHFWLYDKFDCVIPFKQGYYLVTGLSGGFIPGRGFASDSEKEAFEALLKDKLSPEVLANSTGIRR